MKSSLEGSRILVTGGAGFIGSNLVEHLLAQGCEVVALDNFITGKRENLRDFAKNAKLSLLEGDIRDRSVCAKAAAGADFVLHQAALGAVPRSVKDPSTSVDVNICGFVNMLFAAKEAKAKRFVYASSSSVYGDSQESPKIEDRTGRQLSPYAITKYANELFAANFSDLYGIETIGLRYFNVFGRRQDPDGEYAAVIPRFAKALLKHQPPVIFGDGSSSRDFTYIDNVIQANVKALCAQSPEAVNTVYNVAAGRESTLNELFSCIRKELAAFDPEIAKIEPEHEALRKGDIPHSLACIDKAARLLGYKPDFDLESGMRETVRWYRAASA